MNCRLFARLADSYVRGKMPERLREAFEEHYFLCDSCSVDVRMRDCLQRGAVAISGHAAPVSGARRRWLPLAASLLAGVIAISVALYLLFPRNRGLSGEFIEELTRVAPPVYMVSEARSQSIAGNAAFESAMEFYNRRDYLGALSILESLASDGENPQIVFFRGICYLQTQRPASALPEFDQILRVGAPSYHDDALYFKGVALLRLNQVTNARRQFRELAALRGPYSERAAMLLEKTAHAATGQVSK